MQRRTFLQNLLWLTGGLLTGCTKRVGKLNSDERPVTGKITSQGKGLANVVISDGFSVVNTDREGSYQITLTANSEHIFVSIPSGYALPHEKNIARHYKEVQRTDKTEHLFKAIIPKGAQQVKIIATDRFGNRYETIV